MGGTEDPVLKEQIKQVMDMTRRSEDEVIMALHDSDGDLDRAVNDLLEGVQTEWEVKKKKARQPGGSKQNADSSGDAEETGDWEERRNQRGGGPPRLRGRANHDNRGCESASHFFLQLPNSCFSFLPLFRSKREGNNFFFPSFIRKYRQQKISHYFIAAASKIQNNFIIFTFASRQTRHRMEMD